MSEPFKELKPETFFVKNGDLDPQLQNTSDQDAKGQPFDTFSKRKGKHNDGNV